MAIIPLLTSESLLRENKNSITKYGFQVQHAPPTLTGLNHPKSKIQVVHEQKFKDLLLSSKCPVRVGGACWTCNPGPVVQYSLGVIFCYCFFFFFFSSRKDFEVNNGIIANFV